MDRYFNKLRRLSQGSALNKLFEAVSGHSFQSPSSSADCAWQKYDGCYFRRPRTHQSTTVMCEAVQHNTHRQTIQTTQHNSFQDKNLNKYIRILTFNLHIHVCQMRVQFTLGDCQVSALHLLTVKCKEGLSHDVPSVKLSQTKPEGCRADLQKQLNQSCVCFSQ